jgi:D-proline reductase (dithiol) PrdB
MAPEEDSLYNRAWRCVMAHYPVVRGKDVPWTPLAKPLAEARVGLVTSCGVHLASDPPFDESRPLGDPTFRELPADATAFKITHPHYDHRSALQDLNCVYPLGRLKELAAEGLIRSVAPRHFAFMGSITYTKPLIRESAPEVARRFKADAVDVVLLTPC